jgi:hypothetical protein
METYFGRAIPSTADRVTVLKIDTASGVIIESWRETFFWGGPMLRLSEVWTAEQESVARLNSLSTDLITDETWDGKPSTP